MVCSIYDLCAIGQQMLPISGVSVPKESCPPCLARAPSPTPACCRLAGDFGFDPLGLGKDPAALRWYQQAELVHGRTAMAAVAGIIIPSVRACFCDLRAGRVEGWGMLHARGSAAQHRDVNKIGQHWERQGVVWGSHLTAPQQVCSLLPAGTIQHTGGQAGWLPLLPLVIVVCW